MIDFTRVKDTDDLFRQDPYFGEIQAFIDAADNGNETSALADEDDLEILSTFEDSVKTYAL